MILILHQIFVKILKNILKNLASVIIRIYHPDIVAITGSVGKTSTKEAIYAVLHNKPRFPSHLKKQWRVWKAKGNLNNEMGLPLAIIKDWEEKDLKIVSREQPVGTRRTAKFFFWLKAIIDGLTRIIFICRRFYAEILVLEYGADRPGDIKYLLQIARPKIGVITAIGEIPVHVEFYNSVEEVVKEKAKLVEVLLSGGHAILNFDDKLVMQIKDKTKANLLSFGFNEGADVRVFNFENVSFGGMPEGISFKIEYQGNIVPINLKNVFGRAQAYSVAAAFAVGIIYGINLVEIAQLIERFYLPAKRRMNLIKGIKGSWIIDDSYNASPLSMKEALITLKELSAKRLEGSASWRTYGARKIAILGDMLELGKYSVEAHENMGELAASVADILVTVGQNGKIIAEKAREKGMDGKTIFSLSTAQEAIRKTKEILKEGDLILVKASRAIGLDKVVDEIKEV